MARCERRGRVVLHRASRRLSPWPSRRRWSSRSRARLWRGGCLVAETQAGGLTVLCRSRLLAPGADRALDPLAEPRVHLFESLARIVALDLVAGLGRNVRV